MISSLHIPRVRRETAEIEEAAKVEFFVTQEDSNERVRRAKLAVLRRLHQHENFKTFLEYSSINSLILRVPSFNKGTAFTQEERDNLGLRGFLPPYVESLDEQCQRFVEFLNTLQDGLQKYLFLMTLSEHNETVFYKLLCDHMRTYLPILYPSTLTEAYLQYSYLWMFPKGMFLSLNEKGKLREILDHWIFPKVDMIVITDGSRALGIGDLGCYGMGVSVGKTMHYVAAGSFHPARTLPIVLDVGTSNDQLRDHDPHYLGMKLYRVEDSVYSFIDELMNAIQDKWPYAVVQFEDFSPQHARELLERYRNQFPTFNDDIQGTSAVVLAGLLNACRMTGTKLGDQKFLFVGAGNIALDIANLIVLDLTHQRSEGTLQSEAKKAIWMIDQQGVVSTSRPGKLSKKKLAYARTDWQNSDEFIGDVLEKIRPTVLIGATGQKGLFDEQVLRKMAEICQHPIIFALSNPDAYAECTFQEVSFFFNIKDDPNSCFSITIILYRVQ
jgi:malate dehydrogenase (oxaloacetate-decarboxylating)(NADP+)